MFSRRLINYCIFIVLCLFVISLFYNIGSCNNYSMQEREMIDGWKQTNDTQSLDENKIANYQELTRGDTHNPFYIIGRVFSITKKNLLASLQFLIALWLILSFVYYYFEHKAQPKVYRNYGISFLWTFLKSTRDPGEMAPNRPITPAGKFVANIIGLQAIIVVAIPTGLLSSGYIKVMDEETKKEQILTNIERVKKSFRWYETDSLYLVPIFRPIDNYLTRQNLSSEEVIEAVKYSPELHLYNLAKAYNNEDEPVDRIVVVACPYNRPYGYCIDRGSNVTIVSTSGYDEPITSWVAYHIAKFGGFNYVAKELEQNVDDPTSYFKFDDDQIDNNLKLFLDDINRMSSRPNSWVIPMAFSTGPKSREHKVHLVYSYTKKDEGYNPSSIILQDSTTFENLFQEMDSLFTEQFEMPCDKNIHYTVPKNTIATRLKCKNVFLFRVESTVIYFASKKLKMIRTFADLFSKHLEPNVKKSIPPEMLKKPKGVYGYSGYVD